MAHAYELLIIVHPEASEEDLQKLTEKAKNTIEQSKGEFLKVRKWGKRKLVYKLKGFLRGNFLLVYFSGGSDTLKQIDLLLRYNEQVLRYQTIRLADNFDVQAVPEGAFAEAEEAEAPVQEESSEEEVVEAGTTEEVSQ
ncbi:MAG TPA: 30S ribosomal protein S6 [Thermodesulfobacteriota bacterium]|mgnify:FL=1|nr:30S ribosomal protein S6 [Thermodesulfobacteriota bacterium]